MVRNARISDGDKDGGIRFEHGAICLRGQRYSLLVYTYSFPPFFLLSLLFPLPFFVLPPFLLHLLIPKLGGKGKKRKKGEKKKEEEKKEEKERRKNGGKE